MNRRGAVAIGEILIMVVGIVAVAWAIGCEIGEVEATSRKRIVGHDRETYVVGKDYMARVNGDTEIPLSNGEIQKVLINERDFGVRGTLYAMTDALGKEKNEAVRSFLGYSKDGTKETISSLGSTTTTAPTPATTQVPTSSPTSAVAQQSSGEELDRIAQGERQPNPEYNRYASQPQVETKAPEKPVDPNKPPAYPPKEEKKDWSIDTSKGSWLGSLWEGVKWAGSTMMVIGLINLFASKSSIGKYTEPLQIAAPAGMLVGKTLWELTSEKGKIAEWLGKDHFLNSPLLEGKGITWGQGLGAGIGVAVAVAIYVMLYKEEETETITFTCTPWDAPSGGNNCEKCNNNKDLPCSEYQCRSLGQSCQLQNADTDTPLCTWVNRKDVVGPKITLWEEMLTPGLKFTPTKVSSPQDKGTKIVSETGECIPAYTPLVIGIQTDEPAKCKVDLYSRQNMSEMMYDFGSSLFLYNHTFAMSVPGQTLDEETQTIELKNNGHVDLYVKCADSNGNENVGNFVFKFCVDASEDTTAPQILGTNIINGMPIAFNTTKLDIELYTNEPADCRWDYLDKGQYEEMKGTMSCNRKANEINAQMVYTCSATLDGLKNGIGSENNFYFKCRDKPAAKSGRNTNAENYKLTLYGTQQLKLERAGPNGTTIKGNTEPIEVELTARTAAGYKDGAATCYYRLPDGEYIQFFETGSATHSQKLFFETGYYEVPIKCVDAGGNSDETIIKFSVESDTYSPQVMRIFKDEGRLRMITDEDAECVYDTLGCNYQFSDGIAMTASGGVNQYTDWAPEQTYYIKCRDKYLNQPDAGTCTIQLKMYEKI